MPPSPNDIKRIATITPRSTPNEFDVTPEQYINFNLSRFSDVSSEIKNQIGNFIRNKITVESNTLTDAQKKTHLEQYKGENLEDLFNQELNHPLPGGGKKSRKNRRKTKKRRKSKRRRRKGKKSVKSRRK